MLAILADRSTTFIACQYPYRQKNDLSEQNEAMCYKYFDKWRIESVTILRSR